MSIIVSNNLEKEKGPITDSFINRIKPQSQSQAVRRIPREIREKAKQFTKKRIEENRQRKEKQKTKVKVNSIIKNINDEIQQYSGNENNDDKYREIFDMFQRFSGLMTDDEQEKGIIALFSKLVGKKNKPNKGNPINTSISSKKNKFLKRLQPFIEWGNKYAIQAKYQIEHENININSIINKFEKEVKNSSSLVKQKSSNSEKKRQEIITKTIQHTIELLNGYSISKDKNALSGQIKTKILYLKSFPLKTNEQEKEINQLNTRLELEKQKEKNRLNTGKLINTIINKLQHYDSNDKKSKELTDLFDSLESAYIKNDEQTAKAEALWETFLKKQKNIEKQNDTKGNLFIPVIIIGGIVTAIYFGATGFKSGFRNMNETEINPVIVTAIILLIILFVLIWSK